MVFFVVITAFMLSFCPQPVAASSHWREEPISQLRAKSMDDRLICYRSALYEGLGVDDAFLRMQGIESKSRPFYKRAEKLLGQSDLAGLETLAIAVLKTLDPTDGFAVRLVVLTLLGLQAVPEATAKDIQRLVAADQSILLDGGDIRILYRFSDKNYQVFAQQLSYSWDEEKEDITRNPGAGFTPISPTAANEASDSSAPLSAPTSPDGHGAHGDLMTLTGKRSRCGALEGDGTPQDYAASHQPPQAVRRLTSGFCDVHGT